MNESATVIGAGWIAFGVGLTTAIIVAATSWMGRHRDPDLGTVSHQWIAEQRLGQGQNPQR